MMAPSAARARFERTVSSSSPPGMRASKPARPRIQQLATRHEGKQAGETARGEDEADILLSPFLLGQINGYIGTETSQHGRIEKIDSVKTVQARTRWRGFSSMGQRRNECHLLTVLSNQGIDGQSLGNGTAFSAVAQQPALAARRSNTREWYCPQARIAGPLTFQPVGRFHPPEA
ncbi:MAG: hypothetical protein E6G75_23675 [Alphaproteobacteria bacterium]|nr:MAG: hypothetical protein E6G75_23675 [Alphaproteobacteria bacterium]